MLRRSFLGSTVLSASLLSAASASAEISGTDVWDIFTQYYEATGATVRGAPQADGDTLVIAGPSLLYRFPFGVATVRLGLPDITLTDQSDGTVIISFPGVVELPFEFDVPDEFSTSGTIVATQTGYTSVAGGTPGDITFTQSAEKLVVEVKDLILPDEGFDVALLVQSDGFDVTSQVTADDLINVKTDMTIGSGQVAYILNGDGGFIVSNTGTFAPSMTTSEMALPAGGSDVFNLGAALQAGAFVRGAVQSGGNSSETVTTVDGDVVSEQATKTGPTDGTYAIDANGLKLDVTALASTFRTVMADVLPFPVEGEVAAIDMALQFPLLASPEPQDVLLRFGMDGLKIDDTLWDLFDAEGTLPRDPATFLIDLAGVVSSEVDWLNFATLEAQLDQPMPPITADSVTLNAFALSAIGAAVDGTGSFALDTSDLESFDGFPRPEGSALFNVKGANALLDRLTTLGLIGPDEAGLARLGMGFLARATGDDAFETSVEVNADGHVLVNGQRMR